MPAAKRIAVLLPSAISSAFLEGWGRYIREQKLDWEAIPQTHEFASRLSADQLQHLRCDGIIGSFYDEREIRLLSGSKIPSVNVADRGPNFGLPRVLIDHRQVGVLAAQHLMDRGFMRLGCYVLKGHWYADQCREGFVDHARAHARECFCLYRPDGYMPFGRLEPLINNWLSRMKRPVGIFATNDQRSRELLDVCQSMGLRVPEEISVVGAGNQQVVCELSRPSLSSVALDERTIGHRAAQLLDDLLCGRRSMDVGDILVSPLEVIARESSDVVALDNHRIAKAVRFMHDHFGEPININEVLEHGQVSRRFLETEIKRHFDKTPLQYLYSLRLDRAQHLLRTRPRMKLKAVAAACGFLDGERMNAVFRRYTGKVARDFREQSDGRSQS